MAQMKELNPHVSVDCVVFGYDSDKLKVLLVERQGTKASPSKYKLPGDLVYEDEDLDEAVARVMKTLTGLKDIFFKQFKVFGSPDRIRLQPDDLEWLQQTSKLPIKRVVTVAYYSLVYLNHRLHSKIIPGASWHDVYHLPRLAFDHTSIVKEGLKTLRREIRHEPIEFELLPSRFTLRELQNLYEILFQRSLDSRNFRKKMYSLGYLVPLKEKEKNVAHKPAQYFRFDIKKYQEAKQKNFRYSF